MPAWRRKHDRPDNEFSIWAVTRGESLSASPSRYAWNVTRFGSGRLAAPFGHGIKALYETRDDAEEAAAHGDELYTSFSRSGRGLFYKEPIAWLVTFIILIHETGDAMYLAEPCYGGYQEWNDDRDIVAIFATKEEAQACAVEMNPKT